MTARVRGSSGCSSNLVVVAVKTRERLARSVCRNMPPISRRESRSARPHRALPSGAQKEWFYEELTFVLIGRTVLPTSTR